MTRPADRDYVSMMIRLKRRMGLIERRLARSPSGLPDRIGPDGAEVDDWNDATVVGFYWSGPAALNAPPGSTALAGQVHVSFVGGAPVLFQEVRRAGAAVQDVLWSRYRDSAGSWSAWTSPSTVLARLPWSSSAGSFIYSPNILAGDFVDLGVTFPAGRFSVAPIVLTNCSSVRVATGAQAGVSATGCTIRLFNGTTGTAAGGHVVRWEALQMTSGSADG